MSADVLEERPKRHSIGDLCWAAGNWTVARILASVGVLLAVFSIVNLSTWTSKVQVEIEVADEGTLLEGPEPEPHEQEAHEVLRYPWIDYAAVWRAVATDIPLHPRDIHLPQSCRWAIKQGSSKCPTIASYLAVGLDALRESLEAYTALGSSCASELGAMRKRWCTQVPEKLLIMPCAYGREVRAFHAALPYSEIVVADFSFDRVNWTASVFGLDGVLIRSLDPEGVVTRDFTKTKTGKFQLIWLGNLLTRSSELTTQKWLRSMIDLLDWNGVVVFAFYSPLFSEWGKLNLTGVRLAGESTLEALQGSYKKSGKFGFVDATETEKPISVISSAWLEELPKLWKDVKLVYFKRRAYGPHRLHGVAALGKRYLTS